ncbi:hypothetical protein A0O28_0081700 [Trichoderma guizhouense]|uniref:F-box domain-containing protein n=1 Tax=Trichoderma guizhouense TaxID=1491466 RepID=A0A1T3CK23_9HYPO|nr:hypothetical protein A0O28_0081700 [Trichoderma guizhouense]
MPCLERLELEECGTVTQQLPLTRLRSLKLKRSAIGERSLQKLIDSCPKLEYFKYDFNGRIGRRNEVDFEPFMWGQAQRILHSRRKTLKHLRLHFGRTFHYRERPLEEEEYLSSFRDFDILESLSVLTASFGSKDDDATIPIFPENVQHLVSILPKSLTCIIFRGWHEEWNGMRVLAQAIQEGQFPRLKKVVMELSDQFMDESYEEILTPLGVCFETIPQTNIGIGWRKYITIPYV